MTPARSSPLVRRALLGLATVFAVLVALAAPAAAAPDEGAILHATGVDALAGKYVVVFKDSAVDRSRVGDTVAALTARYGGKASHTYRSALGGFAATMSETQAKRLAADPKVAYVEQDRTLRALGTQPNPPSWGLDRIDQRNLPLDGSYTYPNTASNVRAYVIDTGVRITHTDFGGRAVSGRDTIDNDNDASDCNGHGTHVAGTVGGTSYGVAKGVNITAVRVLNCSGSGSTAQVVAGIDWVTADHAAGALAVANMSLGGGVDTALDTAVANSIADGITYAIAAGNSNANACNASPARVPAAITLGSTTTTDARSSFSNVGTCLDLFAPGSDITSAWYNSDTATNTISGTSMASPHAAGAAALVLSANPSFTPQQVRDSMVNNATNGVVTNPGTGSPNKLLFVGTGTPPVNDFSVAVSPTSGSTAPGGSVTATVNTATTAGSAQTVNLSASGLPAGATASFSPASVTSGGSSTMTIATTAGTAPGTYAVTVTGTGASATRTATYSLTVTGGGGGCTTPGQKLGNPGFESGRTVWTASAGVIGQWASAGQTPRTGTWNAWMNGYGITHTDTVTQSVAVPAGCTTYTLGLWLHIKTAERTTTIAYDTLKVQVVSGTTTTTLGTFSNLNKSSTYVQKTFNLSAFAGKTVTVKFLGVEDGSLQTSFLVDDTSLTVS